jgi:hypothetical protein
MFKLPQNPDIAADGLSDDQPLRLEGVKSDGFRQLLRVMYPRYETGHIYALLLFNLDITAALESRRHSLWNNGYPYWGFPLNGK